MPMFDFLRHKQFPQHLLQATALHIKAGETSVYRTGPKALEPGQECRQTFALPAAVTQVNGSIMCPLCAIQAVDAQFEYDEKSGKVLISKNAHVLHLLVSGEVLPGGEKVTLKDGVVFIPIADVLQAMELDFTVCENGTAIEAIVHDRTSQARPLTSEELKRPYAKYFTRYWETPYHLRPDVIAWSQKQHLFSEANMQDPGKMIHVSEINRLMDREYRENQWHEGWTLFEDGTAVACVKTHFDHADHNAFGWYFAWQVLEDLRYMIWYPPGHYGIDCSLETRLKILDPNLSIWDKTHGGNVLHFVKETAFVTSLGYEQSKQAYSADLINFVDMEYRGFTPENVAKFDQEGIFAVSGGDAMLHFYADDAEGDGGTLYTHFWFGQHQNPETKAWEGVPGAGQRMELIVPCMVIGNHATHEFANLAAILGELYQEEGKKPLL